MLVALFLEVMRHRKLTIVAERLGITQSAVSHSLRRLRE
ncbi:LysR family transcriptional regulator, partial [Acinetobacter baumannii]